MTDIGDTIWRCREHGLPDPELAVRHGFETTIWRMPKPESGPPTFPEQTAIAEVLSDMDAEQAVLTRRRDKTRALKQGMMQELLTGRTRLV